MCWCTYKLLEYNVWDQYCISSISKEFLDSNPCRTKLKIKLETQNGKQRKRKRIETEKIEDWLTWPQPTALAH
jgi:hypothetical protein